MSSPRLIASIKGGLSGALMLARFDPAGMARFDLTIGGFWRSFLAALVILPLYAVYAAAVYAPLDGGKLPFLAVDYAAGWIGFPLVMIPVAKLLRLDAGYAAFIIAHNWSSVLAFALMMVVIGVARWLGPSGSAISLALFVAILVYKWFVARTALGAGALTAAVVVAIDEVLSYLGTQGLALLLLGGVEAL